MTPDDRRRVVHVSWGQTLNLQKKQIFPTEENKIRIIRALEYRVDRQGIE